MTSATRCLITVPRYTKSNVRKILYVINQDQLSLHLLLQCTFPFSVCQQGRVGPADNNGPGIFMIMKRIRNDLVTMAGFAIQIAQASSFMIRSSCSS